ncbi:alcohol dehydrogenase catalytic domain-containing protein [Anaerocolumna sedimenticola]|uniref:Alcohol dehydrogenase catalytic domain-containing protein n=1 Tax=Anaerocolumna sedimenticola TaxID=2696063 RepID=A0A6P1TMG7_9FIRM|nr:alcohol dehydrogenase catalytic domain-containing protein [Anaerocolumna sedimenticola]QHQ62410.1 alcohol dehydrogenase catalytic domain-containing protein [Anaerocolumna sedimenticola]
MKALYFDKVTTYLEDYNKPVPGPKESLIKIILSAVCNTDKEIRKGYKPDFHGVLGHEFVGVVEESNNRDLIGKRVVGEINEGCGECIYCKTGRKTHCMNRKVIGIADKDGCFAEYMTIDTDLLHIIPDEIPSEVAVFTEPLAAALEIMEQVHIKPSRNVAVIGDGRLAYMIAQAVSLTGTDLTVIGRHKEKLINFKKFAKVATETNETFEVVIDASGSPSGIVTAGRLVRKKGTIVLKSTYAGKTDIDMSYFVVNEITIKGSRCGPFEPALQLLKRGLITLPAIELYELKDYEQAFESKAFKAGFKF